MGLWKKERKKHSELQQQLMGAVKTLLHQRIVLLSIHVFQWDLEGALRQERRVPYHFLVHLHSYPLEWINKGRNLEGFLPNQVANLFSTLKFKYKLYTFNYNATQEKSHLPSENTKCKKCRITPVQQIYVLKIRRIKTKKNPENRYVSSNEPALVSTNVSANQCLELYLEELIESLKKKIILKLKKDNRQIKNFQVRFSYSPIWGRGENFQWNEGD